MNRGNPYNPEVKRHEEEMVFRYKFNLFMSALIFAVLSFAIQHPVKSSSGSFLKILEIFSWLTLFLSGYFSLVVCSEFPIGIVSNTAEKIRLYFSKKWSDQILMWRLFYLSLFLLWVVKSIEKFY